MCIKTTDYEASHLDLLSLPVFVCYVFNSQAYATINISFTTTVFFFMLFSDVYIKMTRFISRYNQVKVDFIEYSDR